MRRMRRRVQSAEAEKHCGRYRSLSTKVAVAVHSNSTAMEQEHRGGQQQNVPNDIVSDGVVIDIAFHPGKDVIATGTIDGDVKLYSYCDGETPQELLHFTHHKKSCRAVKFSEDGKLMFTASKDKSIHVVDLETGSIAHKITKAHNSAIYSLEVIDNYLIATGDDDGVLKIWDFRRETPIFESKQMEEYVSDLAITREKRLLLATSGEGSLTVFNVRAKRMEMQSEMMNAELLSLAIVKNGTKIVAGCGEGCLNIFNWNEWGCISDRFPGHPSSVDCLIAVNDTVVCSGSLDGVIRAVNILPNRFVGVVGDHNDNPVESLDLARDKRLLASCSHDEKVKFWDISFLNTRKVTDKRKARKSVLNKQLPSSKSKNKNFFKDLMA